MNFESLRWDNPDMAWAGLAVLAVGLGFMWLGRWKRQVLQQSGDRSLLVQMTATLSRRRQQIKMALALLGLALIVLTLMRPKYGVREGGVTNTGIDIVVALDVSRSMLVRDVVPDRLTGAKLEIGSLLGKLHGGRVALVPFAGLPFVQCPLTSDFEVVRSYLQELSPNDMPVPGTAVARALKQAISALTADDAKEELGSDANKIKQFRGSKNKAILLITDGEDHEGEVADVAKEAADAGIRIFTVGVGSASGNVVPILADDGTEIGFMKGPDGKTPLISGLNEALLQETAQLSNGKYFHFGTKSVAGDIYAEIDKLEKSEFDARFQKLGEDRFQLPLLLALLLLLGEWALGDRRRSVVRLGTNTAAKRARATAILAALWVGAPHSHTYAQGEPADARQPWYMTTNDDISAGNSSLKANNPSDALEAYARAKATVPENPILHFNFGLAYLAAGQFDKAIDSISRAVADAPGALRFGFRYALGTANAVWGAALEKSEDSAAEALAKWTSAAEIFEQLLVEDPTHEPSRWNLELALMRVDPPCHKRNDDSEPNDEPGQAAALELSEDTQKDRMEGKSPARLCPGDVDWFGFQVQPGDRVVVEAKYSGDAPEATEAGAPTVELMAADGKTVIAAGPLPAVLPEHVSNSAGALLVRLANPTDDECDVQLSVRVRPPCASKEDDKEDNDTPATAATISQNESTTLRICPGDDDWFEAFLGPGDSLFAFANAEGDFTDGFKVELTDPSGHVLARSASSKGARMAALLEPGAGRYLIRVTASDKAEAPYTLTWKVLPPCPEGNDPLEPNDTPEEAKDQQALAQAAAKLPAVAPEPGAPGTAPMGAAPEGEQGVTALLRICEGDVDYFKVDLQPDEPKIATIYFDHDKGDLELAVLDAEGEKTLQTSNQSAPDRSAEAVALPKVKEETTFLLRVQGESPSAQNFYVLQLQNPPPPSDGQDRQEPEDQKEDQDDQQQEQQEQQQEEQQAQEQPREAIEDLMEQMDRNPENLEAKQALKNSPLRNIDPEKDW